jgi:hypothetical protein
MLLSTITLVPNKHSPRTLLETKEIIQSLELPNNRKHYLYHSKIQLEMQQIIALPMRGLAKYQTQPELQFEILETKPADLETRYRTTPSPTQIIPMNLPRSPHTSATEISHINTPICALVLTDTFRFSSAFSSSGRPPSSSYTPSTYTAPYLPKPWNGSGALSVF